MKKLLKYLLKIFPNQHIVVRNEIRYYSHTNTICIVYDCYISELEIFNNQCWSKEFNTFKEFNVYVRETVEKYLKNKEND